MYFRFICDLDLGVRELILSVNLSLVVRALSSFNIVVRDIDLELPSKAVNYVLNVNYA